MKVYCALESCPHHAIKSDQVGLVDFPSEAGLLRRWLALTQVRHVVRGVTRLCTDHFLPHQLVVDPEWERRFPGVVNPKPSLLPGTVPTLNVPGWLEESDLDADLEPADPPSMFVRQDGSSARRVRPTARLQEAHPDLFDDLPPKMLSFPALRRSRGRPPKGRRGRPYDRDRRPRSPPPDLSDPEVRARLVQQALDEYDWRHSRALETDSERAADGTETLYVNVPQSDDEDVHHSAPRRRGRPPLRGGSAVRSRRGRGVKRRRGAHGMADGDWAASEKTEREPPLAERLPPDMSQRFREVLAAQREVQSLAKELDATPVPAVYTDDTENPSVGQQRTNASDGSVVSDNEAGPKAEDSSLMVLRGGGDSSALTADPLPPEGDHYSTPTTLEVALGLLHQQRLENLRLRADLLRSAIRERGRAAELVKWRRKAAEATRAFNDKLGDMFTPAQLRVIRNRSLRRTHMWDTIDIKRAIELRGLCTRRAYNFVKEELRVPLPGLAVLRSSSQRDPVTAQMYAQMVESHRLKHMTKRTLVSRTRTATRTHVVPPPSEGDQHYDHKYIVLTAGEEGGEGDAGHVVTDPADANALLQSVQAAQAAGQAVHLVDASGAPLLVDRAAGQTPPPQEGEHFLMLVPDDDVEEAQREEASARSPPHRPGILRIPRDTSGTAGDQTARQPPFKLVVKNDGEVVTEDGRTLQEVSWPAGVHWVDASHVSFAE
ncbi:uncharacterized protein LOC122364335 [Amphibalanus amphitrite]|uniref:uncharacterized protein LOC122364335 n=1 Tax=Amphibalanus amphitrite TaxID=1232801 RepID=UPI001C91C6E3|nr:uncharacterized protein LOC122364335 [Amphibalanus amphitrite]XP_043190548.1 uncharacterized protein LOC122364335 [Amphibalanus amphitrite]XP_043190549.1 uncharacterized protein LOC122364335 [Amphibalanus amphitrite]XP_043190550.1 uncharacterized protein LOC122364335 [Amphibalanus amphitrite]